jgi:hypothetical protein
MWGASNGTSHDIVEPPKDLISIQIKSIDTIDRLTFTYKDTKDNQHAVSWGGNLGYDQPPVRIYVLDDQLECSPSIIIFLFVEQRHIGKKWREYELK